MDAPNGPPGDFVTGPYAHGSDLQLRELRRHYYAAISWADFATGKILDELDSLKLTEDTMVVLHSDHGWHLGEYAMWEKRTNWELGTRVPLIMRVPWIEASAGKRSKALVELVDIYQTVCDVMGVALPDDTVPFDSGC
jgi:arylsulfatase A-like enzyme